MRPHIISSHRLLPVPRPVCQLPGCEQQTLDVAQLWQESRALLFLDTPGQVALGGLPFDMVMEIVLTGVALSSSSKTDRAGSELSPHSGVKGGVCLEARIAPSILFSES